MPRTETVGGYTRTYLSFSEAAAATDKEIQYGWEKDRYGNPTGVRTYYYDTPITIDTTKDTGGNVTGGNVTGGNVTGVTITGGNVTGGNVTGGTITGGNVTQADLDAALLEKQAEYEKLLAEYGAANQAEYEKLLAEYGAANQADLDAALLEKQAEYEKLLAEASAASDAATKEQLNKATADAAAQVEDLKKQIDDLKDQVSAGIDTTASNAGLAQSYEDLLIYVQANLKASQDLTNTLLPYTLEQMGFNYSKAEDGTVTIAKMSWDEQYALLPEWQQDQVDLQRTLIDKQLRDLDINPSTGIKFTNDYERQPYYSDTEWSNYQANKAYQKQSLIDANINPDTYEAFQSEEERDKYLTPEQKELYAYNKEVMDYQRKAFKGELPVSEATENTLKEEESMLRERLSQQLGNDYENTTSGIQALAKFNLNSGIIKDQERRGMMTAGEGIRKSVYSDVQQSKVTPFSPYGNMGLLSGLYGNTANLYQNQQQGTMGKASFLQGTPQNSYGYMTGLSGAAMQPYQYEAGLENALNIAEATGSAAASAGNTQLLGTILGTGIAAYGAFGSSPKFKKDIKKTTPKEEAHTLDMVKNLDTNTFRYKEEANSSPKRFGLLTTTAPKGIVKGDYLDVGRTLGLLTTATKLLTKKVDKLEKRG